MCRVLQGHVALAGAVFPAGTPGLMLEMLARGPLWQDGLNYQHGTGHGMGAYLNVHEGPMGIGTFQIFTKQLIISFLMMTFPAFRLQTIAISNGVVPRWRHGLRGEDPE
eukprot:COSAG04_NODE_1560_length_6343_cov_3.386131_4_plen_109_part_00